MKIDVKTCFKIGISIFFLYLCIHYWPAVSALLQRILAVSLPLILGCAIAYVLNLVMRSYEKYYFPKSQKPLVLKSRRAVCMVGAILTLIAVVALVISLLVPQLVSCVRLVLAALPETIGRGIEVVQKHHWLSEEVLSSLTSIDWKAQVGKIFEVVTSGIGSVMDIVLTTLSSVVSVIVTLFIAVIFALYLLWGKERIGGQVHRVCRCYLPEKVFQTLRTVVGVMDECFSRYIIGQCTEAVILGILCIFGMWILRLPYAAMIGALIAFTALIPIAGAYIGAGVGAFMILTVSPIKALVFLIFILVLQQVEGNVIYPKVVGQSLGLPGIWVLAAVTVGGGLFGILGMLLGVPITATFFKLLKRDMAGRKELIDG